ncbi:MAG: DUF1573 domain-containing protein [Acidobacteriota bacterium]
MFKKYFFTILLISGLTFAQQFPQIVITPLSCDMGNIKAGEKATKIYTIKNVGGDNLEIKEVRASCGCTAAKPGKTKLGPGETTELEVTFNSEGREGKQNKTVYIESNDPSNSTTKVSFTANVLADNKPRPVVESNTGIITNKSVLKTPRLSFTEKVHDLGKLKEGKVAQYTFNFTNTGGSTLDIGFVVTTGSGIATRLSNRKIEPGKTGSLKVDFDTSNLQGKIARNIKISSNDPTEPTQTLILKADILK